MNAPVTGLISAALADAINGGSETGRRVLNWAGEPVADALVLRLVGGLHALHRARVSRDLSGVFLGETIDPATVRSVLGRALIDYDADLLPWLEGPPQTNEPGRSAALMTGLLHLARRFGPKFELLEMGSSAGLNLLIDRYRFDLGGVTVGPVDSPVLLKPDWRGPPPPDVPVKPDWRGPPPPDVPVEIVSVRGVDIAPLDVSNDAAAKRLEAYVWVDAAERQDRLTRAIAMLREHGVALDRGDAADWIETRLTAPQEADVTRVVIHSVVWQYLPRSTADRIRAAMKAAGTRATHERPLSWVTMEPRRDLARHEVSVRSWPDGDARRVVAYAHAHGAWIETGGLEAV